jgi:regulator of nucleoside diphosphate kinase
MKRQNRSSSERTEGTIEQRPPIVLTTADREKLFALIGQTPMSPRSGTAEFLREEVERANIATADVGSTSVVRMGSDVKFIDHDDWRIHRAKLVFPEEACGTQCISVLSSVGSALIGLGPGQSIRWTELGRERSLSVLEVCADECASPPPQTRRR